MASKPETVQHFPSTIVKLDADGNTVMSSYVGKGEKLLSEHVSAIPPLEENYDEDDTTMTADASNTNTKAGLTDDPATGTVKDKTTGTDEENEAKAAADANAASKAKK